jgi:hypothetical protein
MFVRHVKGRQFINTVARVRKQTWRIPNPAEIAEWQR